MNIKYRLFLLFALLMAFQLGVKAQKDTNAIKQLLDTAFVYERNDYEKSFNAAKEALSLSEKLNYKIGISSAHRQMGLVYNNKGDFDKAISEFVIAIKFAEKNSLITEQARANLHIGLVYLEMNHTGDAMKYFLRGKSICEKHKIDRGLVQFLMNIGIVHDLNKNYDSALYYFNSTRAFYFKNNNASGMASVENNIANIFKRQKKFAEARPHYMLALGYSKQTNDMYMATNYANIAEIDAELGNHKSAVKYIDSAITTAKSFGSDKIVHDCLVKKQIALEKQGDYKGSSDCFKEILFLKDSILNKDIEKSIIEMQTKYESEKKETENKLLKQKTELDKLKIEEGRKQKMYLFIGLGLTMLMLVIAFYAYRTKRKTSEILGTQNEQINKQNTTLKNLNYQLIESEEELQKSNATKERLLSIISHDLSNPSKALTNYLNIQTERIATLSKDELIEIIKKMDVNVGSMNDLLENLIAWSYLQKQDIQVRRENIHLNMFIQEILKLYAAEINSKQIGIHVEIGKDAIVESDKNLLSVVVRNILNNAIKYSSINGDLIIRFNATENKLSITDSGAGLNKEQLIKLNAGENVEATHEKSGTGLGMTLIFSSLRLLNYKWSVESELGKGTKFEFDLA